METGYGIGYVYFAEAKAEYGRLVKVGFSWNPPVRIAHIERTVGTELSLIHTVRVHRDSQLFGICRGSLEYLVHWYLRGARVNPRNLKPTERGEWYLVPSEILNRAIGYADTMAGS